MLICPNPPCRKPVPVGARACPRCRTDLSLLVTYVDDLQVGLERAEALTRTGELGPAVWAYLEVLEVDPDNAMARRQVGQVAAAVRQFDRAAKGRRWLQRLQRQARFRQWMGTGGEGSSAGWLSTLIWLLLVLAAFVLGYVLGAGSLAAPPAEGTSGLHQRRALADSALEAGDCRRPREGKILGEKTG
jgi:hypothetical protein